MGATPDYLRPYADAVEQGGATFESLLWRSRTAQVQRFDAIIDAISGDLGARTVGDLGSGLGDLAVRMAERGMSARGYVGVEGIEDLRMAAAERTLAVGFPAVHVSGDFAAAGVAGELVRAHGFDTCVLSGSLNTFRQRAAERVLDAVWTALLSRERGEDGVARVLAFNFLSDRPSEKYLKKATGPAKRFDAARMVRFGLERTPSVSLRTDYLEGHDALVVMREVV